MLTLETATPTYQDIFESKNGQTYLELLPTIAKITSGQSFLYRQNGTASMVIDIRLTEMIDPTILQSALNLSLQRYPYLTSKLVEKNANYFLSYNDKPIIISETAELRPLGSLLVNEHLIDVTYSKNTLFVAYHHAIADGRGIMPFVNTLLYYYFGTKTQVWPKVDGVNLISDTMKPNEMSEPFENLKKEMTNRQDTPNLQHDGYQLLETHNSKDSATSYRYEIVIDQASFMKFAKAHNASPAIAVAIMIAQAIQKSYPNFNLPIIAHMASDLRLGTTNQNTFRNCVGSIVLPINQSIESDAQFADVATTFRQIIKESKQPEALRSSIMQMINLFDKLDSLPTLKDKQQRLAFFDNLLLNTFIISYSGQTKLGLFERYIKEMHTYMSGTTGLSIEMLAVNGEISVDMLQSFESDVYANTFTQILSDHAIAYHFNQPTVFTTPKDNI
ncbi:condensation domain-containing protein [Leuconostoc pseudomesenteroides]|uniref:Condensation domain-containing protein n=1 Tax=Leuconostoc pseudomesenteroides TaxID=33968 RepID=A0ABT6HDW0_LEUPS|nr:hypothetical protein [Leuconostoc pseudomesenteroides]MDG9733994.1 hypothetical protein [Leuconostoc pseudomesenteroides]NKZ36664.1 hypothetical protein [Leuconostoc pseudomesenteroides]QQB28368.1 hypothetical protein I6H60_05025 [Leuconostoc pseudomesenteroides]